MKALLLDAPLKSAEERLIVLLCSGQGAVYDELSVGLAEHLAIVNNMVPTHFPILSILWENMGESSAAQLSV